MPPHRLTLCKAFRIALSALCAILINIAALPLALTAKSSLPETFALEQSSKLGGSFYVQISPTKLIATSRNEKLSIFASLPDGKLRIYNKETHRCYLSTLSHFKGGYARNLALLNGFNFDGGAWNLVGYAWLVGIPCARFRPEQNSFDEGTAFHQQDVVMAEYWAGSAECCPKEFGMFLSALFGLPFPGGFPMKVRLRTRHRDLIIFDTGSFVKPKVVVEPKPSDFTPAKNESEVMLRAFDPNNVRPFGSSH